MRRVIPPLRQIRPALLGVALGVVGVGAGVSTPGMAFEELLGLPRLFQLRGPVPAPSSVLVASIDAASVRRLGQKDEPWKWPRSLHAELVDRLSQLGARIIVFDLHFEEDRARQDTVLAEAMRRAGNVVLVEELRSEQRQPKMNGPTFIVQRRIGPAPVLRKAASSSAPFPLPKIPDRVTRSWLRLPAEGTPTLPLAALKAAARAGDPRARAALETDAAQADAIHLGFYGPPGTVQWTSYARLLRGDSEALRPLVSERAVFVGASEKLPLLTPDEFRTPFSRDGTHLSGVEVLATAYANLLHGQVVRPLPATSSALVLMAFGLVVGIVFMRLPALLLLPATLLLGVVWTVLVVQAFEHTLTWWPLATPLTLQLLPGLIGALLWRFVLSRRERERLGAAFGRYLPARAVRELAGGRFEPETHWDLVQGVCLYTDAEQYTALSERLSPTELHQLLNAYYAAIFAPIRRHGGFVSDVVGDAMLALWATRKPNGGPRRAACSAALELLESVTQFNSEHADQRLPTRIGLHCGEIVLGDVGAGDHFEYRAVGDIVNTASRLEGLNKKLGTRVLVTDAVLAQVDGFVSREVGLFRFKGKQRALRVHELLGRAEQPNPTLELRRQLLEDGLAAFRARQWGAARSLLSRLSQETGNDGVANYYINWCERFLLDPPQGEWDGAIVLADK